MTALALATTGHQAALVDAPRGVIVATRICALDPTHAERALDALDPDALAWKHAVARPIHLAPAAERGAPCVGRALAAGTYGVACATHAPTTRPLPSRARQRPSAIAAL